MFQPDPDGVRIGPFWFTPGWSRGNALTVWAGSFFTIAMAAFMALAQPYVLTEMLHVPASRQGSWTGALQMLQELVIIATVGFAGAWSDRVGRRRVYYLGLCAMALAYALYPLATNFVELVLFRCLFAVGVAAVPLMLSACVVDSVQELSRGRWVGANNTLQGLGVVVIASMALTAAPAWFVAEGASAHDAGRYTYWLAALVCLLTAALVAAGLPRFLPRTRPDDRRSMLRQVVDASAIAGTNPRMALAYGAAFIGRGDFAVIGAFFSLWIVQEGTARGMPTAQAFAAAGRMFGIVQLAAMLWAFLMGMITDRVNRVTAVAIALAIATCGYLLMGQVDDPFAPGLIPFAVLLGMGEMSIIVASGALLGQEVPAANRGSVVGFFNGVGGAGILFATVVGGLIFDHVGRTAPFTMMGLLNATLLVAALVVRARAGATTPIAERQESTRWT
jgi:MFS family permease